MKALPWMICGVLAVLAVVGWLRPREKGEAVYLRDTLVVRDTIHDSVPHPVLVRFDHYDTLHIYIRDVDTLLVRDSLYIPVSIERKEYRTEDYRAVISGWHPTRYTGRHRRSSPRRRRSGGGWACRRAWGIRPDGMWGLG